MSSHSGILDSQNKEAGTTSFSVVPLGGEVAITDAERGLFEKSLRANVVHSVLTFLQKPRMVDRLTLTTALPVGLIMQGTSWTSTATDPVFVQKVFGFSGIKYTTNIKVVVNATPFQQGRLRLTTYPVFAAAGTGPLAHYVNRTTTSQLPGIEMNLNDGAMTFEVPWCSHQEYLDVTGTIIDPLSWRITLFSPLLNGPNATITTCGITVWIWYTDVELFGCSTAAIVTQSSKGKSRVKRITVSEQEARPVSSWLGSASRLVSSISQIPTLSAIAGPTSLMLSGLSGVASYFGYSRPISGEPTNLTAPHYHNAMPNSMGLSPASVMAFNKDAKVKAILDYSPGCLDETSVNFVKRQWAYFDEFSWSNTDALGAQLYKRDLNLGYTVPFATSTTMAPITFLSNMFRLYRGGIEIMFKFVKTGFHSGSIAVSCQYGTGTGANLVLGDTDPLYRSIIDIQEGAEFCINFPFMHPADFLETYESFGTWYVHVVNPLISPETVAQRIVVQMYVRGAEDMEFSTVADQNVLQPIYAQGGVVEADAEIVCEVIGDVGTPDKIKPIVAASTVSDTCTSLLQLLKYGSQLFIWQASAPVQTQFVFDFCPSGVGIFTKVGAATAVPPAYQAGFFNAVRSCYGFHRGGYEFTYLHSDGIANTTSSTTAAVPNNRTVTMRSHIAFGTPGPVNSTAVEEFGITIQTGTFKTGTPHTTANSSDIGLGGVLPYRCRYRVSPIKLGDRTTSLDDAQSLNYMRFSMAYTDSLLLRVSDDYQCLYWLGVPPMITGAV